MDDARTRARYRFVVAALTGAATVGSLTAAGVTTGALARAARDDAAGGAPVGPAGDTVVDRGTRPVLRWKHRPLRTVVRVHHAVQVAPTSAGGAAAPLVDGSLGDETLGGGTVSPAVPTAPTGSAGSTGPQSGGAAPSGGGAGPARPEPQPEAPATETVEPPPPTPTPSEPTVPSAGS